MLSTRVWVCCSFTRSSQSYVAPDSTAHYLLCRRILTQCPANRKKERSNPIPSNESQIRVSLAPSACTIRNRMHTAIQGSYTFLRQTGGENTCLGSTDHTASSWTRMIFTVQLRDLAVSSRRHRGRISFDLLLSLCISLHIHMGQVDNSDWSTKSCLWSELQSVDAVLETVMKAIIIAFVHETLSLRYEDRSIDRNLL